MMIKKTVEILEEVLQLPPTDQAELVEKILSSFDSSKNKSIHKSWVKEINDRINAYERGEIKTITAERVFNKIYKK